MTSFCLATSKILLVPSPSAAYVSRSSSSSSSSSVLSSTGHSFGFTYCRCSFTLGPVSGARISSRRKAAVVCMAPDEEKLTRRNPLDFPIEWERPKPGRRPDIFPKFSPMKTPLPLPLPCDPPDEDEEEDEENKEEEEEDPEREEPDEPQK